MGIDKHPIGIFSGEILQGSFALQFKAQLQKA